MNKIFLFAGLWLVSLLSLGQDHPLWMRYPALSPDGTEIVFSYKGDLFKVAATGGVATPLTLHDSHNTMPVWSPDGQYIAFASDRFGNPDVFIMPANGGTARRLTFHSAPDIPWDFSNDGQQVIFSSGRNDLNTSVRFPNRGLFGKLYQVPATGGRSLLISTAGFQNASYDSEGERIIFQDRKGYEDEWRKHHTSSVTRDIWVYDLDDETYTQVSDFEGEDREPLFTTDDSAFFYLSEKNGSQNIYKKTLGPNPTETQVSFFEHHPVRHLSRSNNNTLCYTWNGEIYTQTEGQRPAKVDITILGDFSGNEERILSVNRDATEIALSPNGKEIAFIFRGEVFVTGVDDARTKRITNTPGQERMLSWDPDGRTLYYSTERADSWDIFKASIVRDEELYFFASTLVEEEAVIATPREEFQPVVSPDGKSIAYLEERNILKVFDLEKKTSKTIIPAGQNFSYRDGDQDFLWSPDSKWIVARDAQGLYGASNLVLYNVADPGNGTNLTHSGFMDGGAMFTMNGDALVWINDKEGKMPLAMQGAREMDIFAMFFSQEAFDRFTLSKEDFALLKEQEDKEAKENKENGENGDQDEEVKPWEPLLTGIENRRVRLTPGSVNLSGYRIAPDGEKLYFIATFEGDAELWVVDTRTRELKSLAKLGGRGGSLEISKDGKTLIVVAGGRIQKIEAASGKATPVAINAEMVLNASAEREYIFHHAWRQVQKKFYDPALHGVDWDFYRSEYARFLPHINNNYDFQELLSELLGELNGSHTGGRYSHRPENGDNTASLGLFYDEARPGNGLLITEVITGGPLDKAESKVSAGHIIEKIDGVEITGDFDWNQLLNRKAGQNVLLSLYNPASRERWDEVVKPISSGAENGLLYERWVKTMRDMTEQLSGGRIGYVHVQGMNDRSFRTVYEEVLGRNADKEALIVDTRFNGGGWLHEDLSNFLDGKPYATFRPYGFIARGGEPRDKWSRPSVVLMSESNYSDAHAFPYAYRAKNIGKLIGMPVPGTSTAVWWETQIDPTIVFGIPMIAFYGVAEDRPLENLQLEPDIKVPTPFEQVLFGKDQQLEAAVNELLRQLDE